MRGGRWRLIRRWWPVLALVLLGAVVWLLPISGQVVVTTGSGADQPYPQLRLSPDAVTITDNQPWSNVLLAVDGEPATLLGWRPNGGGIWTWEWRTPDAQADHLAFYHDCHAGCVTRGQWSLRPVSATEAQAGLPTTLGVVFADPARDWHGRSGWDVEMTYARPNEVANWSVDGLASRVDSASSKGLRVLVRVEYDAGQSLPPTGDELALAEYLTFLARLARDDRLAGVYGYVIGSGFNALDSNRQSLDQPVTPEWYARVFNGYGEDPAHTDNALQTMRAERPGVRVLVGPVRPWVPDTGGSRPFRIDVAWLNYMNTLAADLDEAARAKGSIGIALAAPDGLALQAPGRPDAPELAGQDGASEPSKDLQRAEWDGAQAGFRVYRDWLAIINDFPTTRGLPLYITATNTYAPDQGTPPAQNYPSGWLTTALAEIGGQPQVQALVWFMDGPLGDDQWDYFSLAGRQGKLQYAAEEFDRLLQDR